VAGFEQYYAQLTDDQLAQVQIDRKDLVPEALSALDREIQRRDLKVSEPPRWVPDPNSDDEIRSLEDESQYRALSRQKRFMDRFWYLLAFGPGILTLVSAKNAYKDPGTLKTGLGFVVLVVGYWGFLRLRLSAYSCPECAQRFGPGPTCFHCGFPRESQLSHRGRLRGGGSRGSSGG
jgi:hypothetical protein